MKYNINYKSSDLIISSNKNDAVNPDKGFSYRVSARQSEKGTEFSFRLPQPSLRDNFDMENMPFTFISDDIGYKSSGNQIQITVSGCKMANIFSEILNRKVFSLPVFQTDAELHSPYMEPLTSVLHYHMRNANRRNHPPLFIGTVVDNIVKHIAYVWPNTHSAEICIDPIYQPPLALRLALDYIYSKKGVVNGVDDVACNANIGLRSIEIMFNTRIGIGIKSYCKGIKIRNIIQELGRGLNIREIASTYNVSNITRLRKEIEGYSIGDVGVMYPHEYYNKFLNEKICFRIESRVNDP